MRVLKKLFSNKNQRLSTIITVIGLIIGLWILLSAWQVRFDFSAINAGANETFITINKQVNFLNTMGVESSFSENELETLRTHGGIEQVAPFLGNNFKVRANSSRLGFSSEFFFESLPDDFLKDVSTDFEWVIGDRTIPIIIPRQYISLYNFGFAPSQGLPQVSADLIQRFGFEIDIRGSVTQGSFKGKIVGVTDQANTILVPQNFLVWANDRFASGKTSKASRIAILCDAENQVQVKKMLEASEFEINSNQLVNEKSSLMLQLLFLGIMLIGIIIVLLSVFLVYQTLEQLIAVNKQDIQRLFQLGKSTTSVTEYFSKSGSSIINIGFGLGVLLFLISGFLLKNWVIQQGITLSRYPHWSTFVLIIVLFLLMQIILKKRINVKVIELFD